MEAKTRLISLLLALLLLETCAAPVIAEETPGTRTLRIIATGIAAGLCMSGSLAGPLLFLLIYVYELFLNQCLLTSNNVMQLLTACPA